MSKILIIDDDEGVRVFYGIKLFAKGYDVISTGDWSRVMDIIEQETPNLILLDLRLGEYNGLDILQDIKNRYQKLPVILCTAYPLFKRSEISKSADYFVTKSLDPTGLISKIRMALGQDQTVSNGYWS